MIILTLALWKMIDFLLEHAVSVWTSCIMGTIVGNMLLCKQHAAFYLITREMYSSSAYNS